MEPDCTAGCLSCHTVGENHFALHKHVPTVCCQLSCVVLVTYSEGDLRVSDKVTAIH